MGMPDHITYRVVLIDAHGNTMEETIDAKTPAMAACAIEARHYGWTVTDITIRKIAVCCRCQGVIWEGGSHSRNKTGGFICSDC